MQEAIDKLKSGKSDCIDSMMSYNMLTCTNRLSQYIACLFTTLLCDGIAPTGFLLSKLVPIPKIKEQINMTQTTLSRLL